jgi:hypothetical protein
MAEIKSTMDLVLEKLGKMDLEAAPDLEDEDVVKEGMRLAAEFLRGEREDLAAVLQVTDEARQRATMKGMVRSLLRNIVLPRNEDQKKASRRAIAGVLSVARSSGDIVAMFEDVDNILERYLGHRKQMREQLEQAFASQMQQMESSLAAQTGMSVKLQPSQHPKFAEEWQRLSGDLDDQYGRAIEQYKEEIRRRLTGK